MEGLTIARIKLSPIQSSFIRQQNTITVSTLVPKVTRKVLISPGVMRNSKSFNSVAASLQPLESSAAGRFDNTLPSKGTSLLMHLNESLHALCSSVSRCVGNNGTRRDSYLNNFGILFLYSDRTS